MNRVLTGLLIALTVAVFGGVLYVLGDNTKVPQAGQTPGYTAPAETTPAAVASSTPASASSGANRPSASLSPASPTAAADAAHSTLIAFVGDDYTHGLGGTGASASFPALVAGALQVQEQRFYVDGGGYAKSGTNGQTYADLVNQIIAAHPDIVVVSGGRNDRADDTATLTSKAANLFSALRHGLPDAKIVAVAPWWGDSAHPSALTAVDTAVQAGVTSAGGTYLDTSDPLFGHASWMADDADPNDQGYAAIAQSLEPELRPLIS